MRQNDKHPIKSKIPVAKGKHAFECGGQTFVVDEKYEFIKQIGQGAYGVVCSAKNKKNGQMVAVKKIPNAFEDLVDAKRIVREIKLLSIIKVKNVFIVLQDDSINFENIFRFLFLLQLRSYSNLRGSKDRCINEMIVIHAPALKFKSSKECSSFILLLLLKLSYFFLKQRKIIYHLAYFFLFVIALIIDYISFLFLVLLIKFPYETIFLNI